MRLVTAAFVVFLLAPLAAAQAPGECALGTASADLAFGDVHARLYNKGNLFWNGGAAQYEVPKGQGVDPVFAAGIWVGGLVGGELRIAAQTYAQGGNYEFWPGPLGTDGAPPADCEPYDRIWKVNVRDVQRYEEEGDAAPDLLAWPVALGAPVVDGDGDPDNYDLGAGDRPLIYGHETAFWVMNDAAGPHTETESEPIGLEVRATAFSLASEDDVLDRATVYRYELLYRGDGPGSPALEAAHFTLWTDPDLGEFTDDYVGTDTTRALAYVYNSDNDDAESEGGYGLNPPAIGYDFLNGAGFSMSYAGNGATGHPSTAEDYYGYMRSRWKDGTPLTEGGNGYDPDGTPIDFIFPGDPTVPTFWSEPCVVPTCEFAREPDDRNLFVSTPAFSLQPGESYTVDFAVLYARGADHLDSVTELRAASDAVQARYDAGTLFVPVDAPPALPAPALTGPADGATFYDAPIPFVWEPVAGASRYAFELFAGTSVRRTIYTPDPTLTLSPTVPPNTIAAFRWRVRAENDEAVGRYSEMRTVRSYEYEQGVLGDGAGIMETANPAQPPCPDPDDVGCAEYGGNTVWLDPNVNGDYLLTSTGNAIQTLLGFDSVAGSDDFEIRFTEACATSGACLGAYVIGEGEIASVPFELWNVRDPSTPDDDVRMIPMLRFNAETGPLTDWRDTFRAEQEMEVDEEDRTLPVTDQIWWFMPDRQDGYDLFKEAAAAFGGPGAIYDPEQDGDVQIDLNINGEVCERQGWFIDFCYRTELPLGIPLWRMLFADYAEDGTTPPVGTVVRIQTADRLVDSEDSPAQPTAFALTAAYPNPFAASATVEYTVGRAGEARVSVYDVLGRRVAVLRDGVHTAGAHRAHVGGAGLASGVYLIVLEAGGERHTRKVLLVR